MNLSISISAAVLPARDGSFIKRRTGDGVSASFAIRRNDFFSTNASRSSSMLAMPPEYRSCRTFVEFARASSSSSICHGFLVRTGGGGWDGWDCWGCRGGCSSSLSSSLSEYFPRGRPARRSRCSIAALRRNTAMPTFSVFAPVLPTRGSPRATPSRSVVRRGASFGFVLFPPPPPKRLSSSARSARSARGSSPCRVSLEHIARSISSSKLPAARTSAYMRAHGPASASNFCHRSNAGDMKCWYFFINRVNSLMPISPSPSASMSRMMESMPLAKPPTPPKLEKPRPTRSSVLNFSPPLRCSPPRM
mmetsp:Transcript_8230/g.36409  ORF Transcript_8230/g.36409 Transcript_8230/m.36409 type:complete len:306 (+) Transcript_8230:226-1143(+)